MKTLRPLRLTSVIGLFFYWAAQVYAADTGNLQRFYQRHSQLHQHNSHAHARFVGGRKHGRQWCASGTANVIAHLMERSSAYHFQQMNIFWNVINFGLAAGGLYGSLTEAAHGIPLLETIESKIY